MNEISLSDYHFLIFIIPGFLVIWTFRYFTDSKKQGDFELLGLSFVWGLIVLILVEGLLGSQDKIQKLFENPYVAAVILSIFGVILGWLGSLLPKFTWFRKIINFLKRK